MKKNKPGNTTKIFATKFFLVTSSSAFVCRWQELEHKSE
jgi:hypothetical protein